jgi:hypothetical protein
MDATYRIVRMFRDSSRRPVIVKGLTLEQAQAHCRDRETSSSTATSRAALKRTASYGPWFDGYEQEGGR